MRAHQRAPEKWGTDSGVAPIADRGSLCCDRVFVCPPRPPPLPMRCPLAATRAKQMNRGGETPGYSPRNDVDPPQRLPPRRFAIVSVPLAYLPPPHPLPSARTQTKNCLGTTWQPEKVCRTFSGFDNRCECCEIVARFATNDRFPAPGRSVRECDPVAMDAQINKQTEQKIEKHDLTRRGKQGQTPQKTKIKKQNKTSH